MERGLGGAAPVLYLNKEKASPILKIDQASDERLKSDFKLRNYLRQPEKSDSNITERRNLTD